jgi:hypothetical protein
MLLGVLFVIIGWFVLKGASWAIWTAIGLAVLNGLLNFLWLPSQPFWAIVLIAIDVLVIWALATTGQTVAARS